MAAVEHDAFVGVELEPVLFEQFVHVIRVLRDALQEPLDNFIRRREVGPAATAVG